MPPNIPAEDIRSITELMRNTRDILDQLHSSGRPVFLIENGQADAVLLDARNYEKLLKSSSLARCLAQAEQNIVKGDTRLARDFLAEFKRDKKI